ncbi:MAG: tryptophan halogenase, partial [Sphingomonadales bacterium]
PALPAELNRVMDVEYDRIRDFLILHYIANEADAPLWERVRATDLPDTLAGKIERFRHRGHVQAYRDGLFGPPSWQAVFVGQGIEPLAADRLADTLPATTVNERLQNLVATIADAAASVPSHADFIARYCPAPAP